MSFTTVHTPGAKSNNVDIIAIPAIGAEPQQTFDAVHAQSWLTSLRNSKEARVLLYDHLNENERGTIVRELSNESHKASVEEKVAIERRLGAFGIREWADRLLQAISRLRDTAELRQRPIVFIAHSTGGNVLKAAISGSPSSQLDLHRVTVGITFFACPHRGSHRFYGREFVLAIKKALGLKFDMSQTLRNDLDGGSSILMQINHDFERNALGMSIYNYIETEDTALEVLVGSTGETATRVFYPIADTRNTELKTDSVTSLIEAKDIHVKTTHVNVPRFVYTNRQGRDIFLREVEEEFKENINALIRSATAKEREHHLNIIKSIKEETIISVCQFYEVDQSPTSFTAVLKADSPAHEFLQHGPAHALRNRFRPNTPTGGANGSKPKPQVTFDNSIEPPAIQIQRADTEKDMSKHDATLKTPLVNVIKTPIEHTKRPAMPVPRSQTLNDVLLAPAPTRPALRVGNLQPRDPVSIEREHPKPELEPQRAYTFQMPSDQKDKFQWVHVPACVPGLVPLVMSAVGKDTGNIDAARDLLDDAVWSSKHNRSHTASSHARFVRAFAKLQTSGRQQAMEESLMSPNSYHGEPHMVLCIPYLHWDSHYQRKVRQEIIDIRWKRKTARPVHESVHKSPTLEHKLIWQFLSQQLSSIHCRRTLDQYRYPSLRNTEARDNDQVMFKKTKEEAFRNHKPQGSATVLMVDQLWLWVMSADTILTFFPAKEQGRSEFEYCPHTEADVFSNIYNEVNQSANELKDAFDLAALIVHHCVVALLDEDHHMLQVFQVFAQYISEITEDHVESFKQFRNEQAEQSESRKKSSPRYLDNAQDLQNLLELHDIQDELTTIKKLLNEQKTIVGELVTQYTTLNARGLGCKGTDILKNLHDHKLKDYVEQITEMQDETKSALDSYTQLLDMKAKHSNILEARLARDQAELVAEQSRAVMIFTIVTIVFLPLSFLSSIFGMNIAEWSGTDTNLGLNEVLEVIIGVSVAVIIIALVTAFNRPARDLLMTLTRAGRSLLRIPWKLFRACLRPCMPLPKQRRRHAIASLPDLEDEQSIKYLSRTATPIAFAATSTRAFDMDAELKAGAGSPWWRPRRESMPNIHLEDMDEAGPHHQHARFLGIHARRSTDWSTLISPRTVDHNVIFEKGINGRVE